MDAFLNPALLGGAGLAVVPILLHLIMRQRPKHLEFPALRFIRERHESNRRQLRLRHLLLLLLRMAAIALLAAALARPTIHASGMLGADREGPVAAALVFDTLPHMEYRYENKTRLDAAREVALWLLARLPDESQIGVLDAASNAPVFQVDLGAAQQRIQRMDAAAVGQPLSATLEAAAELLETSHLRHEIYVFTDLTRGAWTTGSAASLQAKLHKLREANLYLIDVGVEKPQDMGLGDVRLGGQVLAKNTPLRVSSEVTSIGASGERVVEAYLVDRGKPEKRGQETVKVSPTAAAPVEFLIGGLDQGTHQGFLRIVGEDGLANNDTRYFTADVRSAWKVLIVAQAPAAEQAFYFSEALAPAAFRKTGLARFQCEIIPFAELDATQLEQYAAVFVLDPPPLAKAAWQQLGTYAMAGGGIGIFLGDHAQPVHEFNSPEAAELLAGTLGTQARNPDGDVYLAPDDSQHPLLARFQPLRGSVPWESFPVYRHWLLEKQNAGVRTVIAYSNGHPALLEKPLGKGRVLTATTPVSEPLHGATGDRWNLLPTGFEPWPFVMLVNETALYLTGSSDGLLNYFAGQPAVLQLPSTARFPTYTVTTPRDQFPQSPDKNNALTVTSTESPGNYRVRAGGEQGIDRGFSVNLPVEASRLDRISEKDLSSVFGDVKFRVARDREQIDREVNTGRVGRELFPLLIVIVALVLGLEHVLANRFYRQA
jgi:aerotolerance regulator-like protein